MKSFCNTSECRRARPLLGTFVEVRVRGLRPVAAQAAIESAFAAVARVHALMSPRETASDVARLNRAPLGRSTRVDPWTCRVLAAAQLLSILSQGAFDVTAAPAAGCRRTRRRPGWRDIVLLPGRRVCRQGRQRIDLGGIAKGFAVDRAMDALRQAGAGQGAVNAGGDLRVFGPKPERVHVRHPASLSILVPVGELVEEAMATSANYLDGPGTGRLLRPDGGRLWLGQGSVSVRAPSCLLADALCKVVAAVGPRQAAPLLRSCAASALVLDPNGRVWQEDFSRAA